MVILSITNRWEEIVEMLQSSGHAWTVMTLQEEYPDYNRSAIFRRMKRDCDLKRAVRTFYDGKYYYAYDPEVVRVHYYKPAELPLSSNEAIKKPKSFLRNLWDMIQRQVRYGETS